MKRIILKKMRLKMIKNSLISNVFRACALVLMIVFSQEANAGKCYAKDDIGLGGEYIVPAKAEATSAIRYFLNQPRDDTKVRLLRTGPDKARQVISWLDTGLVVSADADRLVFYVEGSWSPWGQKVDGGDTCECVDACTTNADPENICAAGGIQVNSNYDGAKCYDGRFSPCTIQIDETIAGAKLYGLYGLIASDRGTSTISDPNNKLYWDNLPEELFRTFQITPDASGFFTLSNTQSCTYKPGDVEPTCIPDTVSTLSNSFNEPYKYPIMKGKLYLKILDGHYEDNSGEYSVVVSYGAVDSMGVIESAIKGFENTIVDAANAISLSVSTNSNLLGITRGLLLLYIVFNGLLFAMGMINSSSSELIKRLFKIGIIATVLSPTAFDFFNFYIFSLIKGGFYALSEMILNATQDPANPLQASFAVAAGQTPLSVYDKILNSIMSTPVHVKIWSLLFFKWGGVYIIAIYIGIYYMLLAIGKTMMIYIIAVINMAILVALFPFFIIMILFEVTKSFFDGWIKSFLANAVTVMLLFASIALIMTLLFGLLQTLLAFKVCWSPIWDLPLLDKLKFWLPDSSSEVSKAVTLVNVLAFVIIAVVFDKFTGEIPTLGESITGGSSGIKSAFDALGGAIKNALKTANALNPIGMAISAYQKMKQYNSEKTKQRDKIAADKALRGKDAQKKGEGGGGANIPMPQQPRVRPELVYATPPTGSTTAPPPSGNTSDAIDKEDKKGDSEKDLARRGGLESIKEETEEDIAKERGEPIEREITRGEAVELLHQYSAEAKALCKESQESKARGLEIKQEMDKLYEETMAGGGNIFYFMKQSEKLLNEYEDSVKNLAKKADELSEKLERVISVLDKTE